VNPGIASFYWEGQNHLREELPILSNENRELSEGGGRKGGVENSK
jgi:hypothetical protein